MNQVTIGLGANIGDPVQQLQFAIDLMRARPELTVTGVSPLYESLPMGPQDQPNFTNACIIANTDSTPLELLLALQGIEQTMGKVKVRHWGERCIDLDLLTYDDLHLTTPQLTLPHPGIYERDFVLQPLRDLLGGDFKMPNGIEIDKLLAALPPTTLTLMSDTLRLTQ